MQYSEYDLSSTQKTVRDSAVQYFACTINNLVEKVENEIEVERSKERALQIPSHQMRKCFKLGIEKCPLNPPFQRNKVFLLQCHSTVRI